jgi:hypothetical protein
MLSRLERTQMGSRLAGSVSSSTINIGIPQEKVDELVLDARRSLASARRPGTRHFDLYPAEGPVSDRDRWAMPVTGDRDQAIIIVVARRFWAPQARCQGHRNSAAGFYHGNQSSIAESTNDPRHGRMTALLLPR